MPEFFQFHLTGPVACKRAARISCLVVACAGSTAACVSDVVFVDAPPPADTVESPGGDSDNFAELVVRVSLSVEARQVVEALKAGPPGSALTAQVRRAGSDSTLAAPVDASGAAVFAGVLKGVYAASASLVPTAAQLSYLEANAPALARFNALGGSTRVNVSQSEADTDVQVVAGTRGSLIISEVYGASPFSAAGVGGSYRNGHFIEFYNAADTTVYLGGKILAYGLFNFFENAQQSCESLEPYRTDPSGFWSKWHVRFPGGPRSGPVPPGGLRVLARDAIDHSEFVPGLSNLARADYESIGIPDTDNPVVPNVVDVGWDRWDTAIGHGWFVENPSALALIDLGEAALDDLQSADLPIQTTSPRHRRFPTDMILDHITLLPIASSWRSLGLELCVPGLALDPDPAQVLLSPELGRSVHRRVLALGHDGVPLLQRTGVSSLDVRVAPATPGEIR